NPKNCINLLNPDAFFAQNYSKFEKTSSAIHSAEYSKQNQPPAVSASTVPRVLLIAKIENQQGVSNMQSIIDAADGIMVARGDMGVEIDFELLPSIQKEIIRKCNIKGKFVITATQMLESMIKNPRPTRAEVTDVANAVYDGTSATMLSGETAIGKFPKETVVAMAKIIKATESKINYKKRFNELAQDELNMPDTISRCAVSAAHSLGAKAIVAATKSGATARRVARFMPHIPVVCATDSVRTFYQLSFSFGVLSVLNQNRTNDNLLFEYAADCAKSVDKLVKDGDKIVIVAGVPSGTPGNTNIMKVHSVV
ncbi:MAG: pyruvate kinase, partial [Firmicutes bacterium]|nr:pyruvate kinase [Bacillota bacterium]